MSAATPAAPREPSLRAWALAAGAGYLAIIVSGIFGEFFVRGGLVVPGDPATTLEGIAAAEQLYRVGVAGELVMVVADAVVAAALWILFREVSPSLALLAALLRLAHAAFVGVNLLNAYLPLLLLGPGAPADAPALAALSLELHAYGYAAGLAFFGAHCLVLGRLVTKAAFAPTLLGGLLMVAGVGYLTDAFARTLLLDYAAWETGLTLVVFLPAFVAELSFTAWLLLKGGRAGPAAPRPAEALP